MAKSMAFRTSSAAVRIATVSANKTGCKIFSKIMNRVLAIKFDLRLLVLVAVALSLVETVGDDRVRSRERIFAGTAVSDDGKDVVRERILTGSDGTRSFSRFVYIGRVPFSLGRRSRVSASRVHACVRA